ncbi:hypothetical protein CLD22_00120 [Rubrivivax gelatinosus]|nr:hypothetical protein [Rubrivivax gelatinosus]
MNHFCPALVIVNRLATNVLAPKQQRLSKAREGLVEIAYTKERMTADCPIRSDVAAAERRLKLYEQMAK